MKLKGWTLEAGCFWVFLVAFWLAWELWEWIKKMKPYTISQKIDIAAGAIRSQARILQLEELDRDSAERVWSDLAWGTTVAGDFYNDATDRQARRVVNQAVRTYKL